MKADAFWSVIERARGDAARVTEQIATMSPVEIAEWHATYYRLHNALHRRELWGAAHLILGGCCSQWDDSYRGGCSDDGFHYFKAWVIGKGRAAYEAALRDPDALEPFVTETDLDELCANEPLSYAAEEAYERAGGDRGALAEKRNSNEGEEPSGERIAEVDLPRRFPALGKRFAPSVS